MSLIQHHASASSLFCASANGWAAVQAWAGAIASLENSQVQGFQIASLHLADVFERAGADPKIAGEMRLALPSKVSGLVSSLDGTEISRRAGEMVNDRLERRLVAESVRLRRLVDGTQDPRSGMAAFYRKKVIRAVAQELEPIVSGFDDADKKKVASIRAGLAANETLPFADRYFDALEKNPQLPLKERKRLISRILSDISRFQWQDMVSDMVIAFKGYLTEASLGRDLR